MSRVHGTIQRPVRMPTFALQQDAPNKQFIALRTAFQPATGHSNQQFSSDSAPCRGRNLDTAFRSLTTTLSPPLRGQCSWPAPSFPHQRLSRNRSILGSSAPFGFEAEPGRRQRPEPVFRSRLQHSRVVPRSPLPFGPSFENPSDQSVRPVPNPEARLTRRPIVSCSPLLLLSIPLRISA